MSHELRACGISVLPLRAAAVRGAYELGRCKIYFLHMILMMELAFVCTAQRLRLAGFGLAVTPLTTKTNNVSLRSLLESYGHGQRQLGWGLHCSCLRV